MERAKRIAMVLVCVCAVFAAAKSSTSTTSATRRDAAKDSQVQVQPAAGESRVASCIVKITLDRAVFPLYFDTVDYLVRSSGVAGKAARQVLDLPAERIDELLELEELSDETFQFGAPPAPQAPVLNEEEVSLQYNASGTTREPADAEPAPDMPGEPGTMSAVGRPGRGSSGPTGLGRTAGTISSEGAGFRRGGRIRYVETRPTPQGIPFSFEQDMIVFRLTVHLPGDCPKLRADDFMRAVVGHLSAALDSAFNDHRQQLDSQRAVAEEESDRAERKLLNMQEELRGISSSRSREGLLTDISVLKSDLERMEMESTLNRARMQEMDRQIGESQAKLKDQLANDSVARELRQIVTINEQQLQQVAELTKQKTASAADLQQVQEKLARARIELAKRQEELSKSAAGSAIDSLNRQIADVAMRSTQNEAQTAQLRNRIKAAMDSLADADTYELLSLKVDIAKQNLRETIVWRDQLSRRVRLAQPPSVSVIGAD